MVNIYLPTVRGQVLALSIPFSDIERLSVRPVKWLRFVTFAICGVRGHLSESSMPNGTPVDYDSISLDNIAEVYHYIHEGDYHLIDHKAMNDQTTSSEQTTRSSSFRRDVMARDGPVCVFAGSHADDCDAARLLAKSKGDEFIAVVLQDRLNSYDSALEPNNLGINSVENGMFLAKNLHSSYTPNFALDPADIPRVEAGPMPSSRITLHTLAPDTSFHPILQGDARITGTGTSLPSTVILDYMYGVAAYRRWGSGQDIEKVMDQHFSKHYKSIPMPPASPYLSGSDSFSEPDDPNDGNRRRRNHSAKMSDEMLRAMDKVLALSMLLKGTTPEMMAAERQRREEAEELRAKEASRVKVQQWMQSSLCVLSYLRAISH
ncbi:hypothetical protein F5887DRAFT_1057619 [Amanita rubescens]|nr:hypothetical protein F5887DRAFT_1057619 [Amanita rubescens]